MKTKTRNRKQAAGGRLKTLVRLAREIRRVTGETPGVTMSEARSMTPDKLEAKILEFADWYQRDCENRCQWVDKLISDERRASEPNARSADARRDKPTEDSK